MADNLDEIRDFFGIWKQHKPLIPSLDHADVSAIRTNLGYLPLVLPFAVPHQQMLAEAKALKDFFVYHRASGHHRGWRSLVLHGLSSVHTQGHEHYGYQSRDDAPYTWSDISRFCPVTTAFFRDTFGYDRYDRIRFMLLEPRGYILPHEDVDWKSLGPINLALSNPDGCDFIMEQWGMIPFAPGRANLLAVGHRHAVYNDSDEDRFHIIVHGVRSDVWRDIVIESYRQFRDGP